MSMQTRNDDYRQSGSAREYWTTLVQITHKFIHQ